LQELYGFPLDHYRQGIRVDAFLFGLDGLPRLKVFPATNLMVKEAHRVNTDGYLRHITALYRFFFALEDSLP